MLTSIDSRPAYIAEIIFAENTVLKSSTTTKQRISTLDFYAAPSTFNPYNRTTYMNTTCLQFRDILELIEFMDYTKLHHLAVDVEKQTLTGDIPEAEMELAVNGFLAWTCEESSIQ